jgi:predicted NAD-dependent protein-ADP-ribosyltransferase YbiA (DUF1768 family)
MDISSKAGYPAGALSNFAPHPFTFDGVACSSMEGLLQAFKFDKPHVQVEVCKLVGLAAKHRGKDRTKTWQQVQKLWWNGQEYERKGDGYQELLDRAYIAMARDSDSFRRALLASQNAVFTHSIGRNKENETVLTAREFCGRLHKLRDLLQAGANMAEITTLSNRSKPKEGLLV